ncbi:MULTISPECIES: PepSY domain-containing protein [unclassified Clostridium]|uniref:PepSY domain-containing protein n=1 Tax=unclassified Clostridium TaxID=2614128 RepID=UPI0025C08A99|nr:MULTISPECIES: PepSY domain-containing protein [unclassified Clostridium]
MTDLYYSLWDNYWRAYRINSEAAIQIALEQFPGQVMKVEIDYKGDLLIYKVTIKNTTGVYKVEIDANTGQILEVDVKVD